MTQPPDGDPAAPGHPGPPPVPAYQAPPPAPPGPPGAAYGGPDIPAGMYLDQGSGLLPQGTQLAGVGRRIGAYFLALPLVIVTLGIGYVI